jgi:hypothetical protein
MEAPDGAYRSQDGPRIDAGPEDCIPSGIGTLRND